jgi:plasmid stability protein
MKATVAFRDEALYRAIRLRAAQDGRQIRDVIEEALRAWLDSREEEEDVEAATSALEEYGREGGEDAEAFFRRMVAEGRISYESDR